MKWNPLNSFNILNMKEFVSENKIKTFERLNGGNTNY